MVGRVPEELWTDVCNIVQEAVTKTIPNKKKCKKVKYPISAESQKKAREFQKNIYFCFTDHAKPFDYVDHNKLENS